MEFQHHRNLIIRLTEYGLDNRLFTMKKMWADLRILDAGDQHFILQSLCSGGYGTDNPNHLFVLGGTITEPLPDGNTREVYQYRLVPNAFYNYVDYIEIVEAKKAANEARHFALISIQIAVASIVLSVFIGLLGVIVQLLTVK